MAVLKIYLCLEITTGLLLNGEYTQHDDWEITATLSRDGMGVDCNYDDDLPLTIIDFSFILLLPYTSTITFIPS